MPEQSQEEKWGEYVMAADAVTKAWRKFNDAVRQHNEEAAAALGAELGRLEVAKAKALASYQRGDNA